MRDQAPSKPGYRGIGSDALMFSFVTRFLNRHPNLKAFLQKVSKDNVGALASVVAWSVLTSLVPVVVGLAAIAGFVLQSSSSQRAVQQQLSKLLQGVLSPKDIADLVNLTVQHRGLFGVIGFLGILWGAANVGGAISTVFQPIFQVRGRDFLKEKLIDIGMIFVFTALLIVVVTATTTGTFITKFVSGFPLSSELTYVIGTLIGLVAAFLLFSSIYLIYPNVKPKFTVRHVWLGSLIAAVLFEALTYTFPIYAHFAHWSHYGAVLGAILFLTAWIYFLALILVVGAEFVSFCALRDAERRHEAIGPAPA